MPDRITGHGFGKAVRTFLPVEPPNVTHNDLIIKYKRVNGEKVAYIGKSDRLRAYEDQLRPHVERMRASMTSAPLDGPLREVIKLCYPTEGRHRQGEPKITKPDASNVEKTLNDLIESKGIIANDARVCDLRILKFYSDPAGIWVSISEIEGAGTEGA